MKHYILEKAETEQDEGVLTPAEDKAVAEYATAWLEGSRSLDLERKFPDLRGTFYDIRIDRDLAVEFAND